MVGFLLGYAALDWLNYFAFHETKLLGSLAVRFLRTELHGPFETELRGPFETELHGSLATWPSGLSGSLRTELYDPLEIELQGSFGTKLREFFVSELLGS